MKEKVGIATSSEVISTQSKIYVVEWNAFPFNYEATFDQGAGLASRTEAANFFESLSVEADLKKEEQRDSIPLQ